MSNMQNKARLFLDLYVCGDAAADQIDDFAADWHNAPDKEQRSLSEYLGMTEDEYSVWLMDREALPLIRMVRTTGQPLPKAVADHVATLRFAARPTNAATVSALGNWLRTRRQDIGSMN